MTHSPPRSRSQRLPSIISTIESVAAPTRNPLVSEVLYIDHSIEAEPPTPTATPVPESTRSPPPGPHNLFTTFETLHQQELAGEYPASPTMTSTTNQSTPALTASSALSLETLLQRSVDLMSKHEHHRNESFPDSFVTISSGASPDTEEYMTPASELSSRRFPAFDLTTVSTVSDSGDDHVDVAQHSRLRDMNTPRVPRAACESRWSVGSSITEDVEVADDKGKEKEDMKTPSRLLSLISLLSPAMEKKENDIKKHRTRSEEVV